MIARRIRPPSKGKPGIILKAASIRLMYPSQTNIAPSGVAGVAPIRQPSRCRDAKRNQADNGARNRTDDSYPEFGAWILRLFLDLGHSAECE